MHINLLRELFLVKQANKYRQMDKWMDCHSRSVAGIELTVYINTTLILARQHTLCYDFRKHKDDSIGFFKNTLPFLFILSDRLFYLFT